MSTHLNIEIKARCQEPAYVRAYLTEHKADFKGIDHQTDTYFNCSKGRLKLREGNIEHNLIHYNRSDDKQPKASFVSLYQPKPEAGLKAVLTNALGIKVIVDKQREIYFIDNVKFHIDTVEGLGNFIEIEAIDFEGSIGREKLLEQCHEYMALFKIAEADLVHCSYSDLLLELKPSQPA